MEPATFRRIIDLRLKDRPPSSEGMSIDVMLRSGCELSGRLKTSSSHGAEGDVTDIPRMLYL